MLTSDVIYGFVGSCLVKRFDGQLPIPNFHKEIWDRCCSNYPFIAIAAPRAHAKSTAVTISYTLACVLFRERKHVLLISDTESQACLFLGAIKKELQENRDIIELFDLKIDDKKETVFRKDSQAEIIVEFANGDLFRIVAKGSEQNLRGLLWDGRRPDLIILDDLENDEIVMNKDRREKFKRWFYGALLPLRSSNGIIRYVGTILHQDSMLENLMPKENDLFTEDDGLRIFSTKKLRWNPIKYRAHNENFSKILWKDKFTEEELKLIREDYTNQGLGDVYSQEYLNIPIDDSISYFKKKDFLSLDETDKKKRLNYYVAVDLAISEKERSDWSAFVVAGVDEDNFLHIKNVIREKLDGREIVETLLQLQRVYNPEVVGIEEGQITKALGPFLRESMLENNVFLNLLPLKPHRADKVMRARAIQARMRAGTVKFDKQSNWYQNFEDELLKFPRARHDDQVDALAYIGLMIDKYIPAMTKIEEQEEEYTEEVESSGINLDGRCEMTGY